MPDDVEVGASEVGVETAAAVARRGRHRHPAPTLDDSDREDRAWDVWFKKVYGITLLVVVVGQVVAADVGFFWYAISRSWDIAPPIGVAWLSAAVVQVIGLAWIVIRSVFPPEPPYTRQAPNSQ
ncbi:hypothetical protein LQ327_30405 [Actinomycetospora endophytica]|uniref:Uncharacterized protein n=1 Tax=Actinomycetospora endophytica TaxID=2291215 RepID=A0ABS8PID4_9PSEU|nr:hypothetical protein [Actinomycetospora endophytica]MCD2197692.1 hypothetical protein [Actinomycetospora endophytica]